MKKQALIAGMEDLRCCGIQGHGVHAGVSTSVAVSGHAACIDQRIHDEKMHSLKKHH